MSDIEVLLAKLDSGDVRRRFAEEGRSARNLLVWSVPVLQADSQLAIDARSLVKHNKPFAASQSLTSKLGVLVEAGVRRASKRYITTEKPRLRSMSAGRDPKLDYKARYWAFLFENLRRAVDEIHETCEGDESIAECKEAIMILDNYTKDFHSLIEWIHLKRDFDSTPPRSRPTSLAWEMRRPSSRSSLLSAAFETINKPAAVRALKFNDEDKSGSVTSLGVQTDAVISVDLARPLRDGKDSVNGSPSTFVREIITTGNGVAEIVDKIKSAESVNEALPVKALQSTTAKRKDAEKSATTTKVGLGVTLQSKKSLCTVGAKPHPKIGQSLQTRDVKSSHPVRLKLNKNNAAVEPTRRTDNVLHRKQCTAAGTQSVQTSRSTSNLHSDGSKCESMSSLSSTSSSGVQSWADKVRGTTVTSFTTRTRIAALHGLTATSPSVDAMKQPPLDDDTDGWKMVQRVRSTKSRLTSLANKPIVDTITRINSGDNDKMKLVPKAKGERIPTKSKVAASGRDQSRLVTSNCKARSHMTPTTTTPVPYFFDECADDEPTSARSLPSLHLLKTLESGGGQSEISKVGRKLTRRSQSPNAGSTKPKVRKAKTMSASVCPCNDAVESMDIACSDEDADETVEDIPSTVGKIDSSPLDCDTLSEATTVTIEDELPYARGMLWGEYMDCLDAEPRPPGKVIEIHEKLSSPSRKRSLMESIRRHEEKQAKAQEQRERFLEEKAQRGKEISKKVEEKRLWKEEVTQQRRAEMERKLHRAEEKRRAQLLMIVRKAHDEEEKVNEIAFINSLEAQNKRHDVLSRIQGHEARLQDIQGERQRRQEEKAAKEAAAEERRRALEAERQAKLLEMQEKRKLKEYKIEQHQQEREKERQELAREKARDREERLLALHAAQQATVEELQKKIHQKQVDSARRHEINIEHIRQRALELSILRLSSAADDAPRLVLYDTQKLCTLCNVLIATEVYLLSHLRGKRHHQAIKEKHQGMEPSCEETESYNLSHIINAPADKLVPLIAMNKERQKTLRKRCKKLRQRMTIRSNDCETPLSSKVTSLDSPNKTKIQHCLKEMARCFQNSGSGPWPTNIIASLDRSFGELSRVIEGKSRTTTSQQNDQQIFCALAGFHSLTQVLSVILKGTSELPTVLPSRTLTNACNVFRTMCLNNRNNCLHVLQSNKMMGLQDFLIHRLNLLIPDNCGHLFTGTNGNIVTSYPVDPVSKALMQLMATIHSVLATEYSGAETKGTTELLPQNVSNLNGISIWIQDIISYAVSVGIVDKLSQYFSNVRGPIDGDLPLSEFIQQSMSYLLSLTKLLNQSFSCCNIGTDTVFEKTRTEDRTSLVTTLQITELVGTVSLLYGMLLHTGAPSRGRTPPPHLSTPTLLVITSALHMLNNFAVLDLLMFQLVVGAEGTSLEFRHIVSYLLWYCSHWTNDELLHELILIVGYFTVFNPDNQIVIQSGHMPTVLQQLCLLPFQYFSDPQFVSILFPTIISCCFNNAQNAAILEQELSCDLLAQYIEEKKLDDASLPPAKTASNDVSTVSLHKWALEGRFPRSRWDDAQKFFQSPPK